MTFEEQTLFGKLEKFGKGWNNWWTCSHMFAFPTAWNKLESSQNRHSEEQFIFRVDEFLATRKPCSQSQMQIPLRDFSDLSWINIQKVHHLEISGAWYILQWHLHRMCFQLPGDSLVAEGKLSLAPLSQHVTQHWQGGRSAMLAHDGQASVGHHKPPLLSINQYY